MKTLCVLNAPAPPWLTSMPAAHKDEVGACSRMSGALRENLAQLGAGLVQLRLGGADGAAEYLRDLLVLVAFHVVEDEGGAVAGRQLRQGLVERHAVNQRRPLHPARRDAGR